MFFWKNGGKNHKKQAERGDNLMNIEKEYPFINISELKPYENNARLHPQDQIDKIANSIREFGFITPVIIDENNMILVGHGRIEGAKKSGLEKVPYRRITNLTDEQKKAYILADNKLSDIAEWDEELLQMELESISLDMSDFGFDDFNIDIDEDAEEEVVEDEVPEVPVEPKAKLGDIYKLGRHRLICGDSTDILNIDLLLNGAKVDMIFTDPPYNVGFNGRSGNFDVIKNDDLSETDFVDFINDTIKVIKEIDAPCYYIWCNWKFYGILQKKLDYKSCIVWAKNVFGLGKGYRHQHEFCMFNGEIDEDIKNESDLWEIKKDTNYVHPTQKPVALCARALGNHKKAQNIIDLFGGSGSTLIACEQLGRTCYMCELDPKYVDVIITRWETLTGQKAELIKGGE